MMVGDCLQCELSGFRFFACLHAGGDPQKMKKKNLYVPGTIIHLESFFTILIFIAIIIIFGCCAKKAVVSIWKK
jgi:hypothetical protein